jgi:hypothetical protein
MSMNRTGIFAAAAAALHCAAPASAQAGAPPDPATIVLPDLTPPTDPGVIEDGWKHYYFHKAGVTYEEAYADFSECYRYLPVAGVDASLPMFAPWSETAGTEIIPPANNFGLVGMAIGALFLGAIERKAHQAPVKRCMETRGYLRYPLAENVWKKLIDDYSERSIALQAKAASLPAPALRPVTK